MNRVWTLVLLVSSLASAEPLTEAIEAVLRSRGAQQAIWAIHVRDLSTGATLYENNASIPFTPASNAKLFSSALALVRLGPGHRLETRVLAPSGPAEGGIVRGPLVLLGGGDPSLSARIYPYTKDANGGDPLAPLDSLAEQVQAAGVRSVEGDLIGDDTRFPWEPYPEGWTADDGIYDYGAPVSALTVNDNALLLVLRLPRAAGGSMTLSFRPRVEYFTVHNTLRLAPGAERRVAVDRLPGSRVLRIHGTAPPGGGAVSRLLAVDDPALYAAVLFKDLLERRGIAVRGEARARHRLPGASYAEPAGHEFARRQSPPMRELLQVVNKVSQNLHAELVLRETARVTQGDGSTRNGLDELNTFLGSIGVEKSGYEFQDASGLSRRTLVTAATVTRLLQAMHDSPDAETYYSLLPVAGEDGSLAYRYRGVPGASSIRAKTGTISHVSALAGYAGNDPAHRVAFSIMVNHLIAPASEARALLDRIALEVLKKGIP